MSYPKIKQSVNSHDLRNLKMSDSDWVKFCNQVYEMNVGDVISSYVLISYEIKEGEYINFTDGSYSYIYHYTFLCSKSKEKIEIELENNENGWIK
jgi:hypothetical protein